ncbi:hypothetical protein [Bradyrhizobium lablabi]|uniref:hypothetical protein n=1 Tax=Bradyrhizobium lablabi TaxID=722472 RepID=UPI001BACD10D|nr:hypothetical protein [Bradyrhizobium lablabi]MBR0696491.1 hypothetical protein [Bradyrhizobium lablabi]
MRENDPGNAIDDRIKIGPGHQLALLLGDAEAKQRRLCFCMLGVCLAARRLPPLAPQEAEVSHPRRIEIETVTLPLDHAFGFELVDIGPAAIEMLRQC